MRKAAAVAAIVASLGVAACGSSSSPNNGKTEAQAFADCLLGSDASEKGCDCAVKFYEAGGGDLVKLDREEKANDDSILHDKLAVQSGLLCADK